MDKTTLAAVIAGVMSGVSIVGRRVNPGALL